MPIDPAHVRMYVCGPTVYDFAHIGNARPVIVFDVLYRLLRHTYGPAHVTYVCNITDVDDKINACSARDFPGVELNDAIRRVTEKTANQYVADVTELGCLPPSVTPRATEHLAEMIALNQRLIEKGHCLCRGGPRALPRPLDAGLRQDLGPLDRRHDRRRPRRRRALQARSDGLRAVEAERRPDARLEQSLGSRPSGLAHRVLGEHLGEVFDIHGGGIDLTFPHHENELAQSRCAHGTSKMATIWIHNGFLNVEGEKMSKSLGNFFTIRELLDRYRGENLRLQMLSSHYRQPTNWTEAGAHEARTVMRGWYDAVVKVEDEAPVAPPEAVVAALSDDLNTPEAITELHKLRAAAGKSKDAARALRAGGLLLGQAAAGDERDRGADRRPRRSPQGQELRRSRPGARPAARSRADRRGQRGRHDMEHGLRSTSSKEAACGSWLHEPLALVQPGIVRPFQERLPDAARWLMDEGRNKTLSLGLPSADLQMVYVRHPPSQAEPAVPLEPAQSIGSYHPVAESIAS